MNAEIVAVGSEMLTPQKVDTNSLYLTDQLNALGVEVVLKCVVGDDRALLAEVVADGLKRSKLVIVTGGLGPTEDDVTRDAVANAAGRSLSFNQEVYDTIAERFRRFNRPMAENNRRQAFVIDGAEVLPNDRGTAPGQWLDIDGSSVVLLPGPPKELKGMWELQCQSRLQSRLPHQVIRTRFYRVTGMGESDLDQLIAPIYSQYVNPACTILAGAGDIQIHLRARSGTAEEAEALLERVGPQIVAKLGDRLYTSQGEPLEACVGSLLLRAERSLSLAESCTGGMLAERLTSIPGSSGYLKGGFLTYSDASKRELLGVSSSVLEEHGAVSEAVAVAMAAGARERLQTDFALSVTGVAGPEGGSERTPVGTVFIGLASADSVVAKRFQFGGDRSRVRTFATQSALDLLRLRLLREVPAAG